MSYPNLTIDCHDSNIYVITMRKLPENRLNVAFAQEIIRALREIETRLGRDAEGAVIIRGSDAKFFCTVSPPFSKSYNLYESTFMIQESLTKTGIGIVLLTDISR